VSKGKGLPPSARMRADSHFVDQITAVRPAAVGRLIEIERLEPNPTQPRQSMHGIEELSESIRERGILEPILVRPIDDGARFQIIAGERRYHAARTVGLSLVPCVELDVDDRGALEISLIENLQRRDLTHFEEAEAIARLLEDFSYTHEQVAQKLGRSRSSITEILSLNRMPEAVKEACRRADITTKSTLLLIFRQPDEDAMLALVDEIQRGKLTRDDVRRIKKARDEGAAEQESRPSERSRPYVFRYRPENRRFQLSLRFDEEVSDPAELVSALEEILADLRKEIGKGS